MKILKGGLIGAGFALALLAGYMLLYLIGGIANALRSVDPVGAFPTALSTPLLFFVIYLLPAAVGGFAAGVGVALIVATIRSRGRH